MAYFHKCPYCNGNLDPGETCDCVKEAERERATAEIIKQVQATMKVVLTGGKNGRTSKTKKSRV